MPETLLPETDVAALDAQRWLAAFARALEARDIAAAAALFGDECFWRDLAAFTWNVKTLEGREAIAAMLAANLDAASPTTWRIEGAPTMSEGIVEAWLRFETRSARGRAVLRLVDGRAWTSDDRDGGTEGSRRTPRPDADRGNRSRRLWPEAQLARIRERPRRKRLASPFNPIA